MHLWGKWALQLTGPTINTGRWSKTNILSPSTRQLSDAPWPAPAHMQVTTRAQFSNARAVVHMRRTDALGGRPSIVRLINASKRNFKERHTTYSQCHACALYRGTAGKANMRLPISPCTYSLTYITHKGNWHARAPACTHRACTTCTHSARNTLPSRAAYAPAAGLKSKWLAYERSPRTRRSRGQTNTLRFP